MDTIPSNDRMYNKLINFGGESHIYRINEKEILKKFCDKTSDEIRINKIKKLEIVEKLPISFITKPLSIVRDTNDKIIGYTMKSDTDDIEMLLSPLSKEEKIEALRRLKYMLLELYNYGIFYGDFKEDNILINMKNNNIKFCDIDNVKINELEMDLIPNYIKRYISQVGEIDERTISYIHNILTLIIMSENSTCYDDLLLNLQFGTLDCKFDSKTTDLVYQLVKLDKSYKNEYIIDRL